MRYKDEKEKKLWDSYIYNDGLTDLTEFYYELVKEYTDLYIRQYGIAEHLYLDVYDRCLDALYNAIKTFDIDRDVTFKTYYSHKANSGVKNMFQKRKERKQIADIIPFEDGQEFEVPDNNVEYTFDLEMTSELEKYLTEDELKIIKLYYVEQKTDKEIANILNFKKDNLRQKRHNILRKLKKKLKGEVI